MSKTIPVKYVGRFAPSPTGPLHAGSLVAALASWLDARVHGGQWLVRFEDVDTPRCVPGADQIILQQLAACGLYPDAPPVYQSHRSALYQSALNQLVKRSLAYACSCSRQDVQAALAKLGGLALSPTTASYPGTCRHGLNNLNNRNKINNIGTQKPYSWRFLTSHALPNSALPVANKALAASDSIADETLWTDRRLGPMQQNVSQEVGDFVIKRTDGLWAYQLAVVIDDAAQGVTHIVRGQDLADNTARQILLQRALSLPQPLYLHTPLVLAADGQKLSKQTGALPLNIKLPLIALAEAGQTLGLSCDASTLCGWLTQALAQWSTRFKI